MKRRGFTRTCLPCILYSRTNTTARQGPEIKGANNSQDEGGNKGERGKFCEVSQLADGVSPHVQLRLQCKREPYKEPYLNVFGYNVSVKLHAAEVIFLRFSPISLPFNSFPYLELYPDRGIIIDDARSCAAAGPFAWSLVFLLARLHACMLRGSCYSLLESQHPTMTSSA